MYCPSEFQTAKQLIFIPMTSIINHAKKPNQNTQIVKIKWTTTQDR